MKDVNDVLTAIDHVVDLGFANSSKITVMGLSHGGFLAAHLIGQVLYKVVFLVCIMYNDCHLLGLLICVLIL